jgi:hypothetical protein
MQAAGKICEHEQPPALPRIHWDGWLTRATYIKIALPSIDDSAVPPPPQYRTVKVNGVGGFDERCDPEAYRIATEAMATWRLLASELPQRLTHTNLTTTRVGCFLEEESAKWHESLTMRDFIDF